MTKRSLALCGLLATSCLSVPALAQSAPAQRYRLDGNNVDRISGMPLIVQTELQIGPSGPGGLTLQQYYRSSAQGIDGSVGGVATNWHLMLIKDASNNYHAGIGLTSDSFSRSGNTFTSLSGSGATLTVSGSVYTYTAADGTVITYDYATADTAEPSVVARASKVTFPTGDRASIAWNTVTYCTNNLDGCQGGTFLTRVRLQSVTSSTGYQLHYNYLSNSTQPAGAQAGAKWVAMIGVSAINLGLDYCDPAAYTCTLSNQTAPSVGYSTSYPTGNSATAVVTDALGRVTTYHSDIGLFEVKRPSASTYDVVYTLTTDATFQVTNVVRDGMSYTYAPSLSGGVRTITVTDPLGHVTTTTANVAATQITSIADHPQSGVTRTTTYGIDSLGRITQVTYPEGNYTQYTYDGRGNVTQTLDVPKSGSGLSNITTSAAFPTTCSNPLTCNQPTSTTDADSHVTNYTYDPSSGQVATITSPAVGGVSAQTRYTYTALQAYYKNSAGSIVASGVPIYKLTATSSCQTTANCAGTADEVKSTITYGTTGVANNLLPTQVATGAGNGSLTATRSITYDAVGNPYTTTDPLGHVTRYHYDADRELVGLVGTDPDGAGVMKNRAQRITYNADGLVTLAEQGTVLSQSDADWANFATLQQVVTAYDGADRKIQDSAQAGGTTYAVVQYGYDAASRLQCTAQRMNPTTFTALPSSACTLGTTGGYGPDRITFNTYDDADELLKVTTGYGVSGLQRDETTYTWSNNGKVKTLADARNNLTTYVYDGFDRLYQTQYPSPTTAGTSNTADYEQLGYDAAGNVTSRRLRDGTSIGYGYDALNRMSSKTLPSPEHGVTYAYDNLGHPTTITGATTLSYVFDALGRMTSETQAYGSVSYLYDLANRRTRLTWQDGTYLTYDYDAADEMAHIYENGTTALVSFNYDDLGQRTKRTLATGSITTYGYDPVSRLTSLTMTGGTNPNTTTLSNYSPAGEIGSHANSNDAYAWTQGYNLNRAYTVNGLNQFATIAGATQGYDGRGNLTSSGGVTYAYTSENLLKTVSGGFTLAYDPIGRLQEYDVPSATRFVYDGGMISEELNSSGTVLRRYAVGPAGDEPIVWYEGSGTTTRRYMDQDERGSITRITNQDGSVLAINSYDEYGIPASTNQGRFGYTGQAWLSEIGLAYYKARFYSPTLGRFLQTDPIGYADGPNWYNYVGSDPVNGIDPWGLACTQMEGYAMQCSGSGTGGGGGSLGISNGSSNGDPGNTKAIEKRMESKQQNDQCQGPPVAPGTGTTPDQLKAQAQANGQEAAQHSVTWNPFNYDWFYNQVRNGGPWDYKQYSRGNPTGYQSFGNYNYGYTGAAAGIPDNVLLRAAGAAQVAAHTSEPDFGNPAGGPPYGDDPHDQAQIQRGINDRKHGC